MTKSFDSPNNNEELIERNVPETVGQARTTDEATADDADDEAAVEAAEEDGPFDDLHEGREETAEYSMPEITAIWKRIDPDPEYEQIGGSVAEQPAHKGRFGMYALVAGVAAVSFVAGGVTARLSSQMPMLLPHQEQNTELASATEQRYVPRQVDKDDEEETQQEVVTEVPEVTPQDAPTYEPTTVESTPHYTAPTDDEKDPSEDSHTYRWDFDDEKENGISYDTDNDRVTYEYNGYTFSFDINDLLDDRTDGYGDTQQDTTTYEPYSYNDWRYDSDTGYDDAPSERDTYEWRSWGYQNRNYGSTT